ncbi:Uncharacterised protein [Achromobacter denitrificans]|nr:hypothetical protein LMG1231_03701 [Achromobacter denitrificans]SUW32829.1 Uncharacterised protein [Achromobacter denitrificans]
MPGSVGAKGLAPTLRTLCVLAAPRGGCAALGRPGGGAAILLQGGVGPSAARALRVCRAPRGLRRLGAARRRRGYSFGGGCRPQRCTCFACVLRSEGAAPPWGGPAAARLFFWRGGVGPSAARALRVCCAPRGLRRLAAARRRRGYSFGGGCRPQRCTCFACVLRSEGAAPPWERPGGGAAILWRGVGPSAARALRVLRFEGAARLLSTATGWARCLV